MSKEDGKVLFKKIVRSDRSLEKDELVSLISASCISRQALQRLSGNVLRNDLARLEKNRIVKVKKTSVLSATAPEKFYYVQKFNIKVAKSIDLISYAVYALRQFKQIGRVNIEENGNALADLVIDEDNYSTLEFISLDVQTYKRKIQMLEDNNLQKVLVIDNRSLFQNIAKNYRTVLKDSIVIVKDEQRVILTYQATERLNDTFDFNKLKHSKGKKIVENIRQSYSKAEQARQNSKLKNVNKRTGGDENGEEDK